MSFERCLGLHIRWESQLSYNFGDRGSNVRGGYIVAQVLSSYLGVARVHAMFGLPLFSWAERISGAAQLALGLFLIWQA